MSEEASTKRVLDVDERVSEVLFGLIMVLTFTGSLSVAEAGRDDVRTMLIGAVGCNLVWGIIDGVLYLMGCLAERSRGLAAFRALRDAADAAEGRRLLAGALPRSVASVLEPAELDSIRDRLKRLPEPAERARLAPGDVRGGVAVAFLVFASTFPVAVPFLFFTEARRALRVSNAVAIVMLFVAGSAYGRSTHRHPVLAGVAMVFLGASLVAITMALGG